MAVIAVRYKDSRAYEDLKRHLLDTVNTFGSCEMTSNAFQFSNPLEFVEMNATEMGKHITAVISGNERPMQQEPRNVDEFLERMAKEMGCKLSRPVERPWNILFTKLKGEK